MPVAQAVTAMRAERSQLALVEEGDVVGIAALEDLLEELIGDFEDETDTRPVSIR
jgi:CBS domain containing-hemolysin-like protein